MDVVERIFNLIAEQKLEQKKFAALVGVSPQKVSEWKNGKAKSYTKYILQIAEALNTTTEYLLTGEGPKTKGAPSGNGEGAITEDDIKAAFFNGADPTLTPEERDAMWEDAQEYFRFKIAQRRRKQRDGE